MRLWGITPYLSDISAHLLTQLQPHQPPSVPPTCQASSCLRAFAQAVPSSLYAFPPRGGKHEICRHSLLISAQMLSYQRRAPIENFTYFSPTGNFYPSFIFLHSVHPSPTESVYVSHIFCLLCVSLHCCMRKREF